MFTCAISVFDLLKIRVGQACATKEQVDFMLGLFKIGGYMNISLFKTSDVNWHQKLQRHFLLTNDIIIASTVFSVNARMLSMLLKVKL